MNVFERALEIIDERGWYQGDRHGPAGQRCLMGAWGEANAELHPPPRRRWWQREPPWAAVSAARARADIQSWALRAAIEQVTGERLWGCVARWNDERATEEDVRLAIKLAARNLRDATGTSG